MKINENIKVVGEKAILIPYEAKHVEKYHKWMKNPELQELTASEPLSLKEEYAMQESWRNDEDKCTFLVLSRKVFDETQDEIQSLIGDTNLFLRIEDETRKKVAEAEIMIAESNYRGQGLGWEAILLLLKYAQRELAIDKFEVKIGINNTTSLNMFGKMHFIEVSRSDVFHEVTMDRPITTDWIRWLDDQIKLNIQNYSNEY